MPPRAVSRGLWRLVGSAAFNRIRAVHAERLPLVGPVLYVSTHRNGALDAAVFYRFMPRAVGLVSVQLQRHPLGRLLFPGIAVARQKDEARGMRADNSDALEKCVAHLARRGELVVFPEGTSHLGPTHLPFHTGAARIARAALERGIPLKLVPLGLHYEAPTEWQSRAELLVGTPMQTEALKGRSLAQLHQSVTDSLESVGVDVADAETYARIARLALYATVGSSRSFAAALKCFEAKTPPLLAADDAEVQAEMRRLRPRLHQGIPLVPPEGGLAGTMVFWTVSTPLVAAAALGNLPVLAAAYWASRKLPDAPNVVSFWRMLVGVPVALLWAASAGIALAAAGYAPWWILYLAVSWTAVKAYHRWRREGVALWNALRHRSLRAQVLDLCRRAADAYEAWSDDVAKPDS